MTYNEKLAYLAGIVDGEGCITLWLQRVSGRHLCRIKITNKDEGILNACRDILRELDIFFCEYSHKSRNGCVDIEVNRTLEAKELAEKLLPYLQSYKKQRAVDFINYIESSKKDVLGRNVSRVKKKGWT